LLILNNSSIKTSSMHQIIQT